MFTILFTIYINKPSSGFCQEKIKKNKNKKGKKGDRLLFSRKELGIAFLFVGI
jgi:hypothetical protein